MGCPTEMQASPPGLRLRPPRCGSGAEGPVWGLYRWRGGSSPPAAPASHLHGGRRGPGPTASSRHPAEPLSVPAPLACLRFAAVMARCPPQNFGLSLGERGSSGGESEAGCYPGFLPSPPGFGRPRVGLSALPSSALPLTGDGLCSCTSLWLLFS